MPSKSPHIILIDGHSGVGKTSLALTMAAALGATAVHLDDFYPGWGGLVDGREAVIESVIRNAVAGEPGRIRRWDWANDRAGFDVNVPVADVLIVEGCGISTPESRELADVVLWVECDESVRVERLSQRDGESFDRYRDMWEAQVAKHVADNDPIGTATLTVNT